MKRAGVFLLGFLLLVPTAAWAGTRTASCVAVHFFPNNGVQVRWTFLGFTNHDLEKEATIERITLRNRQGVAFLILEEPFPVDITPVPPGGNRGISTINIFGLNAAAPSGMLAEVEWSKKGDNNLFLVRSVAFTSDRNSDNGGFTRGNFVTGNRAPCVNLHE